MKMQTLKADGLLLLAAFIWGVAFVAQRVGMEHLGPFLFNGIRFTLGSLVLLPVIWRSRKSGRAAPVGMPTHRPGFKVYLWGGFLIGLALFSGATFQQMGVAYTTAGKAGFITGLYVIIVPIVGLAFRQRPGAGTWAGAALAAAGLYLLSVKSDFTMGYGDFLVLVGALCWTCHVLLIGWLSPRMEAVRLAAIQFAVCGFLSFVSALATEPILLENIRAAAVPILYSGLLSVGLAFTLQVIAQRDAPPAHAAILMSSEAVFAAVAGWLILGEILSVRDMAGCGLMLAGMLLSQLRG